MRDEMDAGDAQAAVLSALVPFLEYVGTQLPAIPVRADLGVKVLVQDNPLVARFLLEGPTRAVEAVRRTGSMIPGHVELGEAVQGLLAAGLSGMPDEAVQGALAHASKEGAGFVLFVDPGTGRIECRLAPRGISLDRSVLLFSVEGSPVPNAGESPATKYTAH
jgi:hypothetical protein